LVPFLTPQEEKGRGKDEEKREGEKEEKKEKGRRRGKERKKKEEKKKEREKKREKKIVTRDALEKKISETPPPEIPGGGVLPPHWKFCFSTLLVHLEYLTT